MRCYIYSTIVCATQTWENVINGGMGGYIFSTKDPIWGCFTDMGLSQPTGKSMTPYRMQKYGIIWVNF